MSSKSPPTLDPLALQRFKRLQSSKSAAWLHEEVSSRMLERLKWFKDKPQSWTDWEPVNSGFKGHKNLQKMFAAADVSVVEHNTQRLKETQTLLSLSWTSRLLPILKNSALTWPGKQSFILSPLNPTHPLPDSPLKQVEMIWANMLLHLTPQPMDLIKEWQKSLKVGGWVMFSCLGPDTTKELRAIYEKLGWPKPSHDFTDMHDWGDMLVEAGFSDPVMDMERITLTYSSPESLIADLRTMGRNFHPHRFQALRGKDWLRALKKNLLTLNIHKDSKELCLPLTFEIIYGHAFKVAPKIKVTQTASFSPEDLKAMIHRK
jgi:malonyl-CoA O-methyltransferase